MACSFIEEKKGFLISFSGFAPPYEAFEVYQELVRHPVAQSDSYQLQDFRAIDGESLFIMSDNMVAQVATRLHAIYGNHEPRLYLAMITQSPRVRDFLIAVWDAGAHPPHHEIGVFPTLAPAREWARRRVGEAA
jgi:hypothetical protein